MTPCGMAISAQRGRRPFRRVSAWPVWTLLSFATATTSPGPGLGHVHVLAAAQQHQLADAAPCVRGRRRARLGSGRRRAGDHAQHRERAGVAVDHGLEDQRRERRLGIRLDATVAAALARPRPGAAVGGRGQQLGDRPEQRRDAELARRRRRTAPAGSRARACRPPGRAGSRRRRARPPRGTSRAARRRTRRRVSTSCSRASRAASRELGGHLALALRGRAPSCAAGRSRR